MFLSEEIYNEALRLKDQKKLMIEERLIQFCLSKVKEMTGEDHSNAKTIQILKCINNSYKEAVRLINKDDKLYLNGNLFKQIVEDRLLDHDVEINL